MLIQSLMRVVPALLILVCPVAAKAQGSAAATEGSQPASSIAKSAWDAPEPWRTDRFYFQTSVATSHFNPDPSHDNSQQLIYGEWRLNEHWLRGQWLVGAAAFDNSFGQSSQFVFGGLLWRPVEAHPQFYVKVAAGVLHGYKNEFKDRIPYNRGGWAPGLVPAVGYCYTRFCGEMILYGSAGLLWTFGMTVP